MSVDVGDENTAESLEIGSFAESVGRLVSDAVISAGAVIVTVITAAVTIGCED